MRAPWQPEDLALVFTTCPREPAYFPASLASALLGDPLAARLREIVVAVDAPDLACVAPLTGHARVRWVARTAEENARVAPFHLHRRACHNYWRALGLAESGVRGVLACEDDVVFRDGWLAMLLESLNEMQADGLESFILAAYSAYDHERPTLGRGRYYSSYPAHEFYGTQALVYPHADLTPVREMLWASGVLNPEAPYDLLVGRVAVARQHLYATRSALAQHVGRQSSGLGDGCNRSPTFTRLWPDAAR